MASQSAARGAAFSGRLLRPASPAMKPAQMRSACVAGPTPRLATIVAPAPQAASRFSHAAQPVEPAARPGIAASIQPAPGAAAPAIASGCDLPAWLSPRVGEFGPAAGSTAGHGRGPWAGSAHPLGGRRRPGWGTRPACWAGSPHARRRWMLHLTCSRPRRRGSSRSRRWPSPPARPAMAGRRRSRQTQGPAGAAAGAYDPRDHRPDRGARHAGAHRSVVESGPNRRPP